MENSFAQHWILLGTSFTSEKIWEIKKINFPCGYHIPNTSFANDKEDLVLDFDLDDYWVLGGLAMEINKTGKNISPSNSLSFVKGYRPWISIYKNQLLKDLEERKHTIMIWDIGVSIFYGLWRDNSHKMGELIDLNTFEEYKNIKSELYIDSNQMIKGESPDSYLHKPKEIVNFMSKFMTISEKDIYILGPIVGKKISNPIKNINLRILKKDFKVNIINK